MYYTKSKWGSMDFTKECHIDTALRVIGGKWKLLILWQLTQSTLRFSELEKRIPDITQKMLAQQLRELENDRMIKRKAYPVIPPKVEYSITPHGKSINKALYELSLWGAKHNENKLHKTKIK
jgi:DNA-binding HxlR family transcriptional regulator